MNVNLFISVSKRVELLLFKELPFVSPSDQDKELSSFPSSPGITHESSAGDFLIRRIRYFVILKDKEHYRYLIVSVLPHFYSPNTANFANYPSFFLFPRFGVKVWPRCGYGFNWPI